MAAPAAGASLSMKKRHGFRLKKWYGHGHSGRSGSDAPIAAVLGKRRCIYSTDQRQGIMRLRFVRGSASYEPRLTRGATAVKRQPYRVRYEALPRSKGGATAVNTRRYRG